ncbi:hypothetical protein H0H10_20685 [Streptomyces sp. TRM S81-3]|uniref:Uncharacterized protein n=1 Tax=Streptomyces griseicoloratus TaxID=2752516 RepID=A0A926QSA1_9ACTN|nr:hypothetical protein [Streptomyces griseicoloratus]MBD0421540.1 hypothetical protein [Streptomyces griseicoloratus]
MRGAQDVLRLGAATAVAQPRPVGRPQPGPFEDPLLGSRHGVCRRVRGVRPLVVGRQRGHGGEDERVVRGDLVHPRRAPGRHLGQGLRPPATAQGGEHEVEEGKVEPGEPAGQFSRRHEPAQAVVRLLVPSVDQGGQGFQMGQVVGDEPHAGAPCLRLDPRQQRAQPSLVTAACQEVRVVVPEQQRVGVVAELLRGVRVAQAVLRGSQRPLRKSW